MRFREFQRKLNTVRDELVSRVVKLVPATSFVAMTSQLISLLDHCIAGEAVVLLAGVGASKGGALLTKRSLMDGDRAQILNILW